MDQVQSLNLLKFSGENLLTIINDILDFSKIEAGKIEIENVHFNVKELVDNVVKVHEVKVKEKNLSLSFSFDESLHPFVIGDPVRISQVINNLVGNAVKFTEKGSVDVAVKAGKNGALLFSVKDSGIGIEAGKIGKLFESFTQASSETTRKYGGTGLGLAITKRLVELMGGYILVESKLGIGSEFSFSLTLPKGTADADSTVSTLINETKKIEGIHVLLVEDNRVNQIVASNYLKKWGIEVTYADHGKEAVEKIKSKLFDIVLMDLQMPEMDGYDATEAIRAMDDPYFKTIPILALTADAMSGTQNTVVQVGMNDYIVKPFNPEELQEKITRYAKAGVRPESASAPSANGSIIKSELYIEGDADFKKELAGHLVKNIRETKAALDQSLNTGDSEFYSKACHKVKTTLSLLGNDEYVSVIEKIKEDIATKVDQNDVMRFNEMSDKIIAALEEEIRSL